MARKAKLDTRSVMLAPNKMVPFDHPHIPYPRVVGSLKFDGNRNFNRAGVNLTRNMLPQANGYINNFLIAMNQVAESEGLCFDMEIFDPTATHHGKISGWINASKNAKPIPDHWKVFVFDVLPLDEWERGSFTFTYEERIELYTDLVAEINKYARRKLGAKDDRYVAVEQIRMASPADAQAYFEEVMRENRTGIEGIMLRSLDAVYRQTRVGTKGCALLKFKDEHTEDAQIIDVVQMRKMRKGIARTRNAFGRLETPTRNKDNFTVQQNVGALVVRTEDGREFEVTFAGPCKGNPEGWSIERRRKEIWIPYKTNPNLIIGRWIEFKHYPVGAKEKARSGRMIRFRDDKAGTKVAKPSRNGA